MDLPEPGPGRRVLLTIAYDGTDAAGWQIQPGLTTVQGEVERAIAQVLGEPSRLDAASRTDTGVHAFGQSAAFSTRNPLPVERVPRALNGALPFWIHVRDAREVPGDFFPRAAACGKVYRYSFLRSREEHPFLARFTAPVRNELDRDAMERALAPLVGEHDFRAFQNVSKSPVPSTVKTIYGFGWGEEGPLLHFQVGGSGFLYNMVRIFAGSLVEIGRGRLAPSVFAEALATGDRRLLGPTAPARGLALAGVFYARRALDAALAVPALSASWFSLLEPLSDGLGGLGPL